MQRILIIAAVLTLASCSSSSDDTTQNIDSTNNTSLSYSSSQNNEPVSKINSESLSCNYRQSVGAGDELQLSLQWLSAPNAVAFAVYLENPTPGVPFNVVAGQLGQLQFEAITGTARYGSVLSNSEVELQLEELPSPTQLSDGDTISLKGKLLVSEFVLPLELSWAEANGVQSELELALLASSIDIDCDATYNVAEVVN